MAGYNAKHAGAPDFTPLQPRDLCARTDSFLVVPADAPVAKTFKNGDDIWIVALETALEENNEVAAVQENANRIQASQQSRKDKSYYYWAQVCGGGVRASVYGTPRSRADRTSRATAGHRTLALDAFPIAPTVIVFVCVCV